MYNKVAEFICRHKIFFIVAALLVVIKVVWVMWFCRGIGSFEDEKSDILQRKDWLVEKVVVDPQQLLSEMPGGIGVQFRGEWALYSCSMLTKALANIAEMYPETKDVCIADIDSLIQIVESPELRLYDKLRWDEDPLESLDGEESHLSYLSHLAWMIGNFKRSGGDSRYDSVYDSVCATLNRRIFSSPILNLPTYPDEPIYIPDMMVAMVALSDYSKLNNGKYADTVSLWLGRAKADWTDDETGLLASFVDENGNPDTTIKGSYSALNCYYLTLVDPTFAQDQYKKLKLNFSQKFPASGIMEYCDHSCWVGMDIDAGPIFLNLSPSGTAFAVGSATYFNDNDFRKSLLKTAEIVGHTVKWNGKRHYLLSNIAIVGEAITLAMRTNKCPGTRVGKMSGNESDLSDISR